jgi:hypothetical protein
VLRCRPCDFRLQQHEDACHCRCRRLEGCPECGGEMRIIAFITEGPVIREILDYLDEPTSPPRLTPARGPPLWRCTTVLRTLSIRKRNPCRTTSSISALRGSGKTKSLARRGRHVPVTTWAANVRRTGRHRHRQRSCWGMFFRSGQESSGRNPRFIQATFAWIASKWH